MTHHNIIPSVDNEALRRHASELLYVLSCNKESSNVILLGLVYNRFYHSRHPEMRLKKQKKSTHLEPNWVA
jgi:hypothetical protein